MLWSLGVVDRADETHSRWSTVDRPPAQDIEAGEHADKWAVGDKQIVISVVEGKLP
ncbi:hypothetical protein [Aeromicrobium sp.]|uniref:hypothetical protein n=1 Tax=Aeromicrobium sp. TaxID=1871063 RepID=UPI0030C048C9